MKWMLNYFLIADLMNNEKKIGIGFTLQIFYLEKATFQIITKHI